MDIYSAIKSNIGNRKIETQNPLLTQWINWYRGTVADFHNYRIYNSRGSYIRRTKKHLNLGKFASEKWADLLFNEKVKITLGNDDSTAKLNSILENTNFRDKANKLIEKSFALGLGAFVIRLSDLETDENGDLLSENGILNIDIIHAKKIYPITIENGNITECAFVTTNTQYTNVVIHLKNEQSGEYEITTLRYEKNALAKKSVFLTHSKKQMFEIIYPNIADNLNLDNPIGISVFANAIDIMKSADNKYDSLDLEFVNGKKRVFVSSRLQSINDDGSDINKTFDDNDITVYSIPLDDEGKTHIQIDSSELRSEAHIRALNSDLSFFSQMVGFGKDYIRFDPTSSQNLKTATEVISTQSDLARSLKKHEIVLRNALKNLVMDVVEYSNLYTEIKFDSTIEKDNIYIEFDDSIFEDKESEKTSARNDVSIGVMSPVEYRMKFYGESEEEATENLNKFNVSILAQKINSLSPAFKDGYIPTKLFVKLIFGVEDEELIKYIDENKTKVDFDPQSILSQFGGGAWHNLWIKTKLKIFHNH